MTKVDQFIVRDALYKLADFSRLVGLGRDGLRRARKNGLRVLRAHGRAYIESNDWFSYLERLNSTDKAPADE